MELDKALALLGKPGAYHLILYCLAFVMNWFVAFNHVSLSSVYGIPIQHKCYLGRNRELAESRSKISENNLTLAPHQQGIPSMHYQCIIKGSNSSKATKCSSWKFFYPFGVIKTWVNEFNLVCETKYIVSMSTSIYMAGVMLGSILMGMASDQYGRRPTLLISLAISSVLCLIMAFIPNLMALIIIRFFLGFFLAGVHGLVYIFPLEITARKYYNAVAVAILNSFIFGALIGFIICWLVKDWRMVQIILCIPGFICFILAYILLPESPRWCLTHKMYEKYEHFFKNAMRFNRMKGKCCDEIKGLLIEKNGRKTSSSKSRRRYSTIDVFRTPEIRRRSLIGIFLWFTAGISFYTLVLSVRTLNDNPFLATLIAASTDLPTFLLAFFYLPWFGKRRSLIAVMLLGGTCCVAYKFYNSVVILLIGKAFVAASFGIVFIYLPEIYPTVVRNIGVGTLSLFSRLGGVIAPQIVLLGQYTSFDIPVTIVGCLSLLAGILTIFSPETKDKKVPDTIDEVEQPNLQIEQTENDDLVEVNEAKF